jgi:hypothetical protein
MQHLGSNHVVDNIRLIIYRHCFKSRTKPIVRIADCYSFFLESQSHDLLRVKVGRKRRWVYVLDEPLLPQAGDT